MNNKGQMFIIGIVMFFVSLVLFIALIGPMKNIIDDARGCSNLNCDGYIDKDAGATTASCAAGNQTYTSTLEEDELSCTMIELTLPITIILIVVGLIVALLAGKMKFEEEQYPSYQGY